LPALLLRNFLFGFPALTLRVTREVAANSVTSAPMFRIKVFTRNAVHTFWDETLANAAIIRILLNRQPQIIFHLIPANLRYHPCLLRLAQNEMDCIAAQLFDDFFCTRYWNEPPNLAWADASSNLINYWRDGKPSGGAP